MGTLAGSAVTSKMVAVPTPSVSDLRVYRAVAKIAGETCVAPETTGWSVAANGSGTVSFAPAKLVARFAGLGVKLGGDASYQRWSGVLQKDVGPALIARMSCQEAVFVAMVNTLPLIDRQSGRRIVKPLRPVDAFRFLESRGVEPPPAVINAGPNTGQQISATGTSANYATGGPVANGAGSAIQNIYFGAAVTPDQKQQAHDALLLNLRELAAYPERGSVEPGPTLVQQIFRFREPRALYLLLAKYDRETINSLPNGPALNDFELTYYRFEQDASDYETHVMTHIGTLVRAKFRPAWETYYEYAIRRMAGLPAEQLHAAEGQLNFDITAEDEEHVFAVLRDDSQFGPGLKQIAGAIDHFTREADGVLQPYR